MGIIRLVRELKFKDTEWLWFTIKACIVGPVVYYTVEEGLWSKSEETVKLYEKMYDTVAPYVKQNVSQEMIYQVNRLPSASCMVNCTKSYWNKGVMTSMKFISNTPDHICTGLTHLNETVRKYIGEQQQ